jgi:glycosyltransferase involved in cell wall biosynthesis
VNNTLIQLWLIGSAALDHEAHRSVFLANAWAENTEVRYIQTTGINAIVRAGINKDKYPPPKNLGVWVRKKRNLYHTSRVAHYIPSFPRFWRVPGSWWMNEWLFGFWLKREMFRHRQIGVLQIIVNFCWWLSWSVKAASSDVLIYDCADNFREYPLEIPERVDWAESRLAHLCDAIVVSSLIFKARIEHYNSRIAHIPNGVSQELLNALAPRTLTEEFHSGTKPVVIYHGTVDAWRFNWKLYLSVALLCPEYEFRIYTYVRDIPTNLNIPSNVRILEWVQQRQLYSVLNECSLGFMPYKLKEPTLSGFPVKLFEYFAAGLPVISTRLTEVERFAGYVRLCDDSPQRTATLVRTAINTDNAEFRAARRTLAEQHSWLALSQRYRDYILAEVTKKGFSSK